MSAVKNFAADNTQARRQGLGPSEFSVILGLNKYKSPYRLWMEKTGRIEPKAGGDAARFGTIFEDAIAQEFALREGKRVRRVNQVIRHPQWQFIYGHPDRKIVGERAGAEIKTTNSFAFAASWDDSVDGIPDWYLPQVHGYMELTGWVRMYVPVVINGQSYKCYTIERDDAYGASVVRRAAEWWLRHIVTDTPPPITTDEDLDLAFTADPSLVIQADDHIRDLVKACREAKAGKSAAVKAEKAAVRAVKSAMGNATILLDGDTKIASYPLITKRGIDAARLRSDLPEIAAEYNKPSVYRSLNLT